MTNDEKAKAYEMALEAARKELGVDRKEWEVVEHVLHNIFPVLRESEDERIRKEIINFLRSPFVTENITDEKIAPWLAYLEKQKEQVTDESDKIAAAYQLGRSDERKQKEQKPAEWSEEDENVLKYLHDLISWGYAEKFMDAQTAHDMRVWINERLRHDTFQNGNSRPKSSDNWKPSEEHLSALLAVFNDPDNIGSQTCQLALLQTSTNNSRNSDMTNAELNEEIKRFVAEYGYERSEDILLIAIVARQFYELGCHRTAEKYDEIEYNRQRAEESVPKDLEEAAHSYSESDEPLYSPGHRFHWDSDSLFGKQIETTFIAGAKWQKEQMLKDAVDATLCDLSLGNHTEKVLAFGDRFPNGAKVRIIIVKEDEK